MAKKCTGSKAPYDIIGLKTTYCTGSGTEVLSSTSYNSCVGLILYDPHTQQGAVAHFPGGQGNSPNQVKLDVAQILGDLTASGTWKAYVFGGMTLKEKNPGGSVEGLTKPLIGFIWGSLANANNFNFNSSPSTSDPPETKPDSFVGHGECKLDLATGKITYADSAIVHIL